ncbi:ATP-grasp domain-containing protein [Baekduia sp. Peel2402]|uniref:ATP-grasp domain-containing protein n=1 Tax=Baekduia sp. Peel2402 TaxID=3458296 RepID=UPI00403E571B
MSGKTRVALATCSYFPDGDEDDVGIPAAIGGDVAFAIWDDPAVDWSTYDLVVIRSTWDYQGRRDDYLAWAQRLGDRLINPYDVIAWNTDKRYLRELADAGLPVVATELVEPGEAFVAPSDVEYVVKPTVSAGSRDTARFAPGEEARAAELVAAIHASGRTAMVQPYIASVDARGETATLCFDGAFSHAIHKSALLKPGAAPTSEVFAAETIEPREATAAERAVGERVLAFATERFGPLAYARIDLVEDADGNPMVLELELTEPSLFFAGDAGRLSQFASAVRRRLPER